MHCPLLQEGEDHQRNEHSQLAAGAFAECRRLDEPQARGHRLGDFLHAHAYTHRLGRFGGLGGSEASGACHLEPRDFRYLYKIAHSRSTADIGDNSSSTVLARTVKLQATANRSYPNFTTTLSAAPRKGPAITGVPVAQIAPQQRQRLSFGALASDKG